MYINRIRIENFRILSNSVMYFEDKKDNLCLMIGKNNSGKTSLMILFEKFFKNYAFDYNDFSIKCREEINSFNDTSDSLSTAIRLVISIKYEKGDDLSNIAEFIMNLDPDKNEVNILMECCINKRNLLEALKKNSSVAPKKFIQKYLTQYLDKNVYIFDDDNDLKKENRGKLVKKSMEEVKKLIDFEIIHAKRSVSSSEEENRHRVLSGLTTKFYNSENQSMPEKFESINALIEKMDSELEDQYKVFFNKFVEGAKDFLNLDEIKVISNLRVNEIIGDSSEVIYGNSNDFLPEYLNGLGHMNILYLLLTIEIKKSYFISSKKDIKLLFIEEPEAHTHPQLQYIFGRKIAKILDGIPGLQTIITTHSPHIVANHPFENIRYMMVTKDDKEYTSIHIKNFHKELSEKYKDEIEEFQFIKEYLSIEAAELFFASKVIFIEGVSENILMPYFIARYDNMKREEEQKKIGDNTEMTAEYIPISSQNISIMQVGANAKAFRYFLEFLGIKALVITDIDTNKKEKSSKGNIVYKACPVADEVARTSNATLAYFYNAPDFKTQADDYAVWLKGLIAHTLTGISNDIRIFYQKEENGYAARSFEDAFINVNRQNLQDNIDKILGLKNKDEYNVSDPNAYTMTQNMLAKKSDFASSILFNAHTKGTEWNVPLYIWEGLEWIQKN